MRANHGKPGPHPVLLPQGEGPRGAQCALLTGLLSKDLEPIIGGHPPNIKGEDEFNAVKKTYLDIKTELDSLLVKKPKDQELLFLRGHLQSMGHNFDYPGAWQGSTDDLRALLKENPGHVPALIELANLWVNSNPQLAPNAEKLFRGAQCYYGNQPLEAELAPDFRIPK